MFTKKIFLLIIIISFFVTSCYKKGDEVNPPDDSVPETMEELDVPQNFNWKTTKTIDVQVTLPNDGEIQPLIITNRAGTKRYFRGYPENDNSRTVTTKITIPTYLSELRLFYNGTNGPNMAVIEGEYLSYNFNNIQKSVKAVTNGGCDLSGFETYSKGGWHQKDDGNNVGSIRDEYFDDVYPDEFVIGYEDGYTITFDKSKDVEKYLPGGGKAKVLTKSYNNPKKKLGNMADQIIAARLNVDFDAAGYIGSNPNFNLGELVFNSPPFMNMTVNEFLDLAETALGGGGLNGYTVDQFKTAAENINLTFDDGENVDALTCPNDEEAEEDYPFIEISSICAKPDGIFTITNTGEADMNDSQEYRVYRNGNLIDTETGSYDLDINESKEITVTFNSPDDVIKVEADIPEDATNEDDMIYTELTDCGDEDDGGNTTEQLQGTLAYEDLWPGKGDYDFNDLVIDYDFNIVKNNQEVVQSIIVDFKIKAFGASQHNGFGFTLPTVDPGDIASVSGYDIQNSSVFSMAANGVENNQSSATFILFDDVRRVMPQGPVGGVGVNTQVEYKYIDPVTITMEIEFQDNAITFSQLDIGTFDPFIVVNTFIDGAPGNRGREVHLPGEDPTDLMDESWFGQLEDDSQPSSDRYFVTENNLPWAINIAEEFDWVVEFQDITGAYTNFAEWAESDGINYPDWYQDKTGYRNDDLIYPTQKGIK